MLQNGVIPCRIVDTPTHLGYYVKEEDLRAYKQRSHIYHTSRPEVPRVKILADKVPIKWQGVCNATKIGMARESDTVVYKGNV